MMSSLVRSLRPSQWTKNFIIFAALIFARRLTESSAVLLSLAAFAVFCALSGVVYLVNDIVDREADRRHPLKRNRPIASGALPVSVAATAATLLGGAALAAAFFLRFEFGIVAACYVALLALYSGPLKHVVIIDVLTIAIGFVLRAVAGAVVINVEISNWLLIVTILLALFLALSKRRHELVLLADGATSHRPILEEYSPYLLDQMISVVTASTLVSYAFYTVSPDTVQKFGTDKLGLTLPFPLVRDLPLPLPCASEGGGRQPFGSASQRPAAPGLRRPLGRCRGARALRPQPVDILVTRCPKPKSPFSALLRPPCCAITTH